MLKSPVWRGAPQYAFGLGLVAGGVLSAAGIVVLGSLLRPLVPPAPGWGLVAAAFVALAAREVGLVRFAMPQNARLVPETVFRHGPFWGPFEFGLEMGTGMRTYVTSGLPYVVLLAIALLAPWQAALVAGVGFGLGRFVMTSASLRLATGEWDLLFDAYARLVRGLLLGAFALTLLVAALASSALGG